LKNKILLIFVCLLLIIGIVFVIFLLNNSETKSKDYDEITNKIEKIQNDNTFNDTEFLELWETNIIGTLEIPSINLKLSVAEGIDDDILENYIGHFPSTSLFNGNVGIAGHNTKPFFANLNKVKIGDEITYNFLLNSKTYVVDTIVEIEETTWDYLEDTNENKITLITCIVNEPTKRLCVQATEK